MPIPSVFLSVLDCAPLTLTAMFTGGARPHPVSRYMEAVAANADGTVFMIDCQKLYEWNEAKEELSRHVVAQESLTGTPLEVLANWWNAQGAMSVGEMEQSLHEPQSKLFRGLRGDDRPFVSAL